MFTKRTLGVLMMALLLHGGASSAAETPDEMVANFVTAYQDRDLVLYDITLHPDFVFLFAPEDAGLPGIPPALDRAQELAVTDRMFSGQPGQDPDGEPIPPITGFDLALSPVGEWAPAAGEFEGAQVRVYQTDLRVTFAGGLVMQVGGAQELFARPVASASASGTAVIYQLEAWRDLGVAVASASTANETVSWGRLKTGHFDLALPVSGLSLGTMKVTYDGIAP